MASNRGSIPHGVNGYKHHGCRCLTCRREESLRVRAAYESSCAECGGPTWGTRCRECIRRNAKRITLPDGRRVRVRAQPEGLHYQWGCP